MRAMASSAFMPLSRRLMPFRLPLQPPMTSMDSNLDTNIKGLHCLGDSSGWTRGLMMASVMGVLMGRKLAEKEGC